ncbi:MAG: GNAT family N-acetyltransferase [Lachnospiraceae bacterium]|nr:GNAT family N-acetyltransferase [Lachnospiraceae bacterium]
MDYKIIREADRQVLVLLHSNYKREIGEDAPTKEDIKNLFSAIDNKSIVFYGCYDGETLIACCSITRGFSTFNYSASGVLEDFYILPEYRHKGIARKLIQYAFTKSGVGSLTVGCADCDKKMYRAIGFSIPLGNLLAYEV